MFFGMLHKVEPPCATTPYKQPLIQNIKNVPSQSCTIETLVINHFAYMTGATVWADGFIIFHCF